MDLSVARKSRSALSTARFYQGISQQKLAELIGVSQATLSRIERSRAPSTPKIVKAKKKIAAFLETPLEVLFPEIED
jgi:transcriptional regulator with XRE-family HTH domain